MKELSEYPETFAGAPGENINKSHKLIESFTANQVREKDKVEVLRKQLKERANNLPSCYTTFLFPSPLQGRLQAQEAPKGKHQFPLF